MTDDIVTRLRDSWWNLNPSENMGLCESAADEIEHLRTELANYKRTVRAHEDEIMQLRKLVSDYVSLWHKVDRDVSVEISQAYFAKFYEIDKAVRDGNW